MSLCVIISFPPSLSSFQMLPHHHPPTLCTPSDSWIHILFSRAWSSSVIDHILGHTKISLHSLKDRFLWLFPSLVFGENLAGIYFIHLVIHISSLKIEKLFFLCLDNYRHAYDMPKMGLSYLGLTKSIWFSIWGLCL